MSQHALHCGFAVQIPAVTQYPFQSFSSLPHHPVQIHLDRFCYFPSPHHHHVDKNSLPPLRLHPPPLGNVRPHRHIPLPRPPPQNQLVARQQTHEHRHSALPTHGLPPPQGFSLQTKGHPSPAPRQ